MANLMKIQKELLPPAEEKKEDKEDYEEESKDFTKEVENILGASGKEKMFKKLIKQPKGRTFDNSDDDEKNKDEEDDEGEENFDVDEKLNANDVKSISAKSMTDVENNPENQLLKTEKPSSTKINQRILILFDRMKITLGEVVSDEDAKTQKFEAIIDHERSEIPHVNILEMFFEGLEIEVNNGETQNINLVMNRLLMRDLQKVSEEDEYNEFVSRSLIPSCFHNILCNPDIEQEYDDEGSMVSFGLKTVRTEDFKSIVNEESFAAVDRVKTPIAQLKLIVKIDKQTTSVEFLFADLRLTGKTFKNNKFSYLAHLRKTG
jgi:hypothetical protein